MSRVWWYIDETNQVFVRKKVTTEPVPANWRQLDPNVVKHFFAEWDTYYVCAIQGDTRTMHKRDRSITVGEQPVEHQYYREVDHPSELWSLLEDGHLSGFWDVLLDYLAENGYWRIVR